jgi:hypothetical protein
VDIAISLDFLIVAVWCNVSVWIYLVPLKHEASEKADTEDLLKRVAQ